MRIYSVHEPPAHWREARRGPENFAFVRDGFHFWAFLLTPLWMLRHRLWLVLIGYLVLVGALVVGLRWAGVSANASSWILIMLSLLIGLEAGSLRRWTLRRRQWIDHGVVAAKNLEEAERRFFDAWTGAAASPSAAPAAAPASAFPPGSSFLRPRPAQDIVGLFPEPGAPR
jgi:hypothetical protein